MEPTEALFIGENEHLVIEKFIGRALTIEEMGSIKPEAFPVNIDGLQYRLLKIPREWSVHPNKQMGRYFDSCTSTVVVINLETCNSPSVLDPAKNQITAAFDTIKEFASLSFMDFGVIAVIFLMPSNLDSLVGNSTLDPYTDDPINSQVAMQRLSSYTKELVKAASKDKVKAHVIQCNNDDSVRDALVAGLKDIILGKAFGF